MCAGEEADMAVDDDDDDIAGISGGEFKNIRCILTQIDIYELVKPVQDSREWIWEHQAIVEHINRKGGVSCPNPAQPAVQITLGELKDCSKRIKRAAQKHKRQMGTHAEHNNEEIL